MKKTLLICFLALLCLYGSTTIAQVADSPPPGVDTLHRFGDPSRGGETRPDTFSPGSSLVDMSDPAGQEESTPSAQVGRFHLELPAHLAPDTLWVTYWEHFLEDNAELTPGTTFFLVASKGDLFQGNMGFNSYQWIPPQDRGLLYFKVRSQRSLLINGWALFPTDQVRVRMDFLSNAQFIGPSAEFFRTQYILSGILESQKLQTHPLMVTANPQRIISDSATLHRFQMASSLPKDLYPSMVFLVPGLNEAPLLDSLLSQPLGQNPVILALPGLTATLNAEQKNLIVQRAWGEVLKWNLSRINLGRKLISGEPYLQKYQRWKTEIPDFTISGSYDPALIEAAYSLAILEAHVYNKSLFATLEGTEPDLKDRILGRYVISNFRKNGDAQASSLRQGLDLIETGWIRELLLELQNSALPGAAFDPDPLINVGGELVDLSQFEGKTLVISFWISGCRFCVKYYQNTLKPVFEQFSGREDVVFVSVNADTHDGYWRESLTTGKYAHPDMINLHQDSLTGILKQYQITSFPQKLLIGPDFRLFLLTKSQFSPDRLAALIDSMSGDSLTYRPSNPQ